MYKLKLTLLQQEILRFLFIYAEKSFTGRTIAKSLNASQPGISKALVGLKKKGLIELQKDKLSRRLAIRLNRENDLIIGLKRADNLRQIYESGFAKFIESELPGATIILFGSYSRGDDTSTSDIDVAVIGRKFKDIDFVAYERLFRRKIILQFYTSMPSIHKELRENLCNGIVLVGGIEL